VVQLEVQSTQGAGTGSGFIISSDGYIVTNNHVAGSPEGDGAIEIVFSDGSRTTGRLVGASADYDLAVVKVDKTSLPTLPLGTSANLQVGEPVVAVGSPLGLAGTVTTGIVSSLNRPVTAGGEDGGETAFINAIQTDAAINPGNSGGPLVNAAGQVIGVNSAIATLGMGAQSGNIGLGFAIPIDTAKRVADELIANGSAKTPIIGVQLDMQFEGPGAKVAEVTAGGPSETAGMQVGDVITELNGKLVDDGTALIVGIRSQRPGDTVQLTVQRGGQEVTVPVTLGTAQ
jgi:putative serine protease PepD